MGRAAGAGSDVVVVTSDNPRSEDPLAIIEQVLPGLSDTSARVIVEPDRRHAIELAIAEARQGDLVLLAGKGHEKTQTIGAQVIPFDDVAIAREILAGPGKKQMKLQLQDIAQWIGAELQAAGRGSARSSRRQDIPSTRGRSCRGICFSPSAASVTMLMTLSLPRWSAERARRWSPAAR